MFSYQLSKKLLKKTNKLLSKDPVLADILDKKIDEISSRNEKSINMYKNLHSPQHEYKRVHLTSNFVLLFHVDSNQKHIIFTDILHWDVAYK